MKSMQIGLKPKILKGYSRRHGKEFINENLTQRRKRLFWNTKQKAKELEYNFFWTHNGQNYIRKDEAFPRLCSSNVYTR